MAFGQAAVLASGADVATQMLEHGVHTAAHSTPVQLLTEQVTIAIQSIAIQLHLAAPASGPIVNAAHVAAMALVASTMSGGANAVWLRQLEEAFPGKSPKHIAAKTLIHACILASIINSAYLIGVPLLSHAFAGGGLPPLSDPSAYFAGWTWPEFVMLTKLELCMFVPYNAIAFKFVPPRVRPLTHAMVSATFNVAVSAITLGYWDVWCQRVLG